MADMTAFQHEMARKLHAHGCVLVQHLEIKAAYSRAAAWGQQALLCVLSLLACRR